MKKENFRTVIRLKIQELHPSGWKPTAPVEQISANYCRCKWVLEFYEKSIYENI